MHLLRSVCSDHSIAAATAAAAAALYALYALSRTRCTPCMVFAEFIESIAVRHPPSPPKALNPPKARKAMVQQRGCNICHCMHMASHLS